MDEWSRGMMHAQAASLGRTSVQGSFDGQPRILRLRDQASCAGELASEAYFVGLGHTTLHTHEGNSALGTPDWLYISRNM
jgi:hypothetical protein